VEPDPSEQTCHDLKPRDYHEMCTNSTRMVSDLLIFVGSNPTFISRIHSMQGDALAKKITTTKLHLLGSRQSSATVLWHDLQQRLFVSM
jgi:hypothetical protein